MIRSMTGFGQASAEVGEARVIVELRAVNHRYADLRMKLPQELASTESEIRRKVLARIKRGRIELWVSVGPLDGGMAAPRLNQTLLDEVLVAARTLGERYGVDGRVDVNTLLAIPGMFRTGPAELAWDAAHLAAIDAALDAALEALDAERAREGSHLRAELSSRLRAMAALVARARERAAALPRELRERLVRRLETQAADVALDPTRVAQEAVLLADRADVTEEIVRLEGHLARASELVDHPDAEPVGKRLDFLLQEIHRETNTVNSKSADLELGRLALALKVEAEKVREQLQNLE
jgi:uncharacterized protein (TIGR00255 family)